METRNKEKGRRERKEERSVPQGEIGHRRTRGIEVVSAAAESAGQLQEAEDRCASKEQSRSTYQMD